MAATIIDTPLDTETDKRKDFDSLENPTTMEDTSQVEATEQPTDDIPDKYKNKSIQEIIKMHQEAESLVGRQSSEVGELRKVVDSYIQTQLVNSQSNTKAPTKDDTFDNDQEEYDWFTDPDKAVAKAIEKHPKLREAEQVTQQYKKQMALSQLQAKHPDMQQVLQNPKFAEWIKGSKVRTKLFVEADQGYDYDAADELFTLWKERQQTVQQTAQAEKAGRKEQLRAAATGGARGNADGSMQKTYRRADIIKLMKTDPDRYMALSDEIMKAYRDGRVK